MNNLRLLEIALIENTIKAQYLRCVTVAVILLLPDYTYIHIVLPGVTKTSRKLLDLFWEGVLLGCNMYVYIDG